MPIQTPGALVEDRSRTLLEMHEAAAKQAFPRRNPMPHGLQTYEPEGWAASWASSSMVISDTL
jgi:hypothetical protein